MPSPPDRSPDAWPGQRALRHVRDRALQQRPRALASLAPLDPAPLVEAVRRHARVTLNFHPDRLLADGRSVAEALLEEGIYRSQFETGISNGSRTAFPGGPRDQWEERIFGGAYQGPGVLPGQRPKYGALNLMHHPDGASPRFGSCHLRLRAAVLDRCTFVFGDSYLEPEDVGTIDVFEPLLARLFASARETGSALGLRVPDLAGFLLEPTPPAEPGRALDDYIEAEVHGVLTMAGDVEALVMDPSFAGTRTGALLEALASRHGLALRTHAGFELPAEEVPAEFRGPAIPPLAERVVREFATPGAPVDAALIGRAAASAVREPERWEDRGPLEDTLQHLKQLWHVLVRYGLPCSRAAR